MRLHTLATMIALALAATAPAHADELKADLTGVYGASGSGGSIDLKLNQDGSIAVTLTDALPSYGFAIDSPSFEADSGFSVAGPQGTSWGTGVGTFYAGWFDGAAFSSGQFVQGAMTWTLGTPGSFTSVWQAVDGGHAQYDFLEISTHGYFVGDAVSAVPEAPSALMLAAGLGVLGLARRRARAPKA